MAMSDEQIEGLSALMDGEIDIPRAAGVLDRISRDPELRATWERYHLVQMAIRRESIVPAARPIAQRVADALAAEPVPIRRRPSRPGRIPSSRAPFGGAALAAAAVFLAVFAAPKLLQGPSAPVPSPERRQVATLPAPSLVAERRWELDRPELESKLDLFLVNHQEAAPAAGVKGILPYATLVGYDGRR